MTKATASSATVKRRGQPQNQRPPTTAKSGARPGSPHSKKPTLIPRAVHTTLCPTTNPRYRPSSRFGTPAPLRNASLSCRKSQHEIRGFSPCVTPTRYLRVLHQKIESIQDHLAKSPQNQGRGQVHPTARSLPSYHALLVQLFARPQTFGTVLHPVSECQPRCATLRFPAENCNMNPEEKM